MTMPATATDGARAPAGPGGSSGVAAARPTPAQWRQAGLITLGAVALFVVVRLLPTGTNLAHVDFQVSGGNVIQFCDPGNPAFLPVVAVKSPVTMTLVSDVPPAPGRALHLTVALRTFTGRPIGPEDLLVTHEHKLHLMIVDPSLRDYQHVHPVPGPRPGDWEFAVTPREAGSYRVFADFMPAVTARGLYASAEFSVPGRPATPPPADNWTYAADGLRYELAGGAGLHARDVASLTLTIAPADGHTPVVLQPVMAAFAHLVAFDEARSGFAHIHPLQTDLAHPPDPRHPQVTFKVQIPQAGRYVIWSQIRIAGRERFARFWFEVLP